MSDATPDTFQLPSQLQPAPAADFASEYDVSGRVPDFAGSLAAWRIRSSAARVSHPGLINLRYGEAEAETLDLFLPPEVEDSQVPLLIFIHGGFWRRLHKDDFSWVATPYVANGVAVAVDNYGLAPTTCLDEIIAQTRRSIAWLFRHAHGYHIDSSRIVVSGHSAGGHLTCMALATDWPAFAADLPANLIAAGIALSPVVDLAPLAEVPLLNDDLDFDSERIRTLSPIRLAPATEAPLTGAVGGKESAEFRRQLTLLAHGWSSVWAGAINMPEHDHLTLCDAFADHDSALFKASLGLCTHPSSIHA